MNKEPNWDELVTWDRIVKVALLGLTLIMLPMASCVYDKNEPKFYQEKLEKTVVNLKQSSK